MSTFKKKKGLGLCKFQAVEPVLLVTTQGALLIKD